MFLKKKINWKARFVSTVNFLSGLQVIISSPDQLSALMAGGEPVWLPEITCLWLKISPCKLNSVHSWPKDNSSLTAPTLLVQMDFRENKFSPDWGHFSMFHYRNSENFFFLHPCFRGRESLLFSACHEDVLECGFLFFRTCQFFIGVTHPLPNPLRNKCALPQEPHWRNS